jgi:hypothetical protein
LWLTRRRARLAVITEAESRYAALGYTGSTAQEQSAALSAGVQALYDWREDGTFRQIEEETVAPYFGGFEGA